MNELIQELLEEVEQAHYLGYIVYRDGCWYYRTLSYVGWCCALEELERLDKEAHNG